MTNHEGGLLQLAKQLGNVADACRLMGYSRDSFYRFKELYERGGDGALQGITAADLLHDRVLPLFEEHDIPFSRLLTDRGRAAARPGEVGEGVQRGTSASGPLVLRQDPDADVSGERAAGHSKQIA
jgi:hypothetical protein